MALTGKRIALFVEEHYQELEVWYPYYRLIEEGADVTLIGSGSSQTYKGKFGYPAKVDAAIGSVKADQFDALVIPGGFAPDYMRREPKMVQFVKEMNAAGKIIAAICHGGWMLASAEVVTGKTVTCFFAIADDLRHAGATYVDKAVVQDGNIVTSRKPEDLPQFCKTIIKALQSSR